MISSQIKFIYSAIIILLAYSCLETQTSEAQFTSHIRRGHEKKEQKFLKEIVDIQYPIDVKEQTRSSRRDNAVQKPMLELAQSHFPIETTSNIPDELRYACDLDLLDSNQVINSCCNYDQSVDTSLGSKIVCGKYAKLTIREKNNQFNRDSSALVKNPEAKRLEREVERLINRLVIRRGRVVMRRDTRLE